MRGTGLYEVMNKGRKTGAGHNAIRRDEYAWKLIIGYNIKRVGVEYSLPR
jgi:hypothetical protein